MYDDPALTEIKMENLRVYPSEVGRMMTELSNNASAPSIISRKWWDDKYVSAYIIFINLSNIINCEYVKIF